MGWEFFENYCFGLFKSCLNKEIVKSVSALGVVYWRFFVLKQKFISEIKCTIENSVDFIATVVYNNIKAENPFVIIYKVRCMHKRRDVSFEYRNE